MHEVPYVWLGNCWNNMEKICCRNKISNHHGIQQQKRIVHSDNVLTKALEVNNTDMLNRILEASFMLVMQVVQMLHPQITDAA